MDETSNTLEKVIGNVTGWAKQPFSMQMSVGGWFLFFGLIMAISVAWAIVLKDLRGEL